MPAQFVLKKGSTGKFRFNLVARNGQVIATSEAYETRAKALAGIESVRKNAPDAVLVDGTAPAAKPAAKATARKGTGTAGTTGTTGTSTGGSRRGMTSGTTAGPIAGPDGRTAADVKPQTARGRKSPKTPPAVTPADAKGSGGTGGGKAVAAVKRAAKKVTPGT